MSVPLQQTSLPLYTMSVPFLERGISKILLPFLIFKYQIGPPSFTTVEVTHSRSVTGILHVFKCISLALVGKGEKRCRNTGRNGSISLAWRFELSEPISRICTVGAGPLVAPSRTNIPAVRMPSWKRPVRCGFNFKERLSQLTFRYTTSRFGINSRLPTGDERSPTWSSAVSLWNSMDA